jgi:hypothetical protein
MRSLCVLGLALALAGCASEPRPAEEKPITSRQEPQDPPRPAEAEEVPPLGSPRKKVSPSEVNQDRRAESLLRDEGVK